MINLRIHGDNIVECERAWSTIRSALACSEKEFSSGANSVVAPSFEATSSYGHVNIQYFPGFGRWVPDILNHLKSRGATLREAADAIICIATSQEETPILAIEFCGALSAGNQAWQRCGRAHAFAAAKTPYIYLTEIGGFELDSSRKEKASRLPNPVVPFGYITLTAHFSSLALPVFIPNPAIDIKTAKKFSPCFGLENLHDLLRSLILGKDINDAVQALTSKLMILVNTLSVSRRTEDTFRPPKWAEWLESLKKNGDATKFICDLAIPWEKTAYIKGLTKTAKSFIAKTAKFGIGVGASQVPICIISAKNRIKFAEMTIKQYPSLRDDFRSWLKQKNDLGICWIMGFKPRGDDARPDRGLVPLARMLLGSKIDLLTFIYGPAKSFTWPLLRDNPQELAKQNGLWEAIMVLSDALLVDSKTDRNITDKGYLRSHWSSETPKRTETALKIVNAKPTSFGENDVDTIIHLLFTTKNQDVFEGMCNPPGGDWSGISIIDATANDELRWLSLPRVSQKTSKRPDHVFEFLKSKNNKPIILSIESKESSKKLEKNIGARLVKYTRKLLSTCASVQRSAADRAWERTNRSIDLNSYRFASAVTFILDDKNDLKYAAKISKADLVLGISILMGGASAMISLLSNSDLGKELSDIIESKISRAGLPLLVERVD